jgi:hypothetical protein
MTRKLVFARPSWCRKQTLRWQNQRAAGDRVSISTVGGSACGTPWCDCTD